MQCQCGKGIGASLMAMTLVSQLLGVLSKVTNVEGMLEAQSHHLKRGLIITRAR